MGAMCCVKESVVRHVFVVHMEFAVKQAYEFKYTAVILKIAVFCKVSGR
jgi:hypothetical protein